MKTLSYEFCRDIIQSVYLSVSLMCIFANWGMIKQCFLTHLPWKTAHPPRRREFHSSYNIHPWQKTNKKPNPPRKACTLSLSTYMNRIVFLGSGPIGKAYDCINYHASTMLHRGSIGATDIFAHWALYKGQGSTSRFLTSHSAQKTTTSQDKNF